MNAGSSGDRESLPTTSPSYGESQSVIVLPWKRGTWFAMNADQKGTAIARVRHA